MVKVADNSRTNNGGLQLFPKTGKDDTVSREAPRLKPWKGLIVDDEEEIHALTNLVLGDYTFEGRSISFESAYSAEEAKKVLSDNPDIALILLDVVMETQDAGLLLTQYIREEMNNKMVRIILRTGQPGQAPEHKVITDYDVNDYKEKTELTSQKLYTTVTAALRSYRDIMTIERSRIGLKKIIDSSASLFELQSLKQFVTGVLNQLTSLLYLNDDSLYMQASGFAATEGVEGEFIILAATGAYEKYSSMSAEEVLPPENIANLKKAVKEGQSVISQNNYIGVFPTSDGRTNIVYVDDVDSLTEFDKDLIQVFATNVTVGLDNNTLHREIIETQKEVIITLGEVVETRSKETANHVRRVGALSSMLAEAYGSSNEETQILRLAAPMHDVGKIGIPDAVLNKPGKLTPEEYEVIKQHTTIGYDILKSSNRVILKTAATIALQHHESWDGSGYPQGLAGEDIHLHGRIVKIIDVFDALRHKRVYKPSWKEEDIIEYLLEGKGTQFDPKLVDLFMENIETVREIYAMYPDNDS